MNSESFNKKLNDLPPFPGVYFFINKDGKIIYIGKAKNLKNRVKSYFSNTEHNPKTKVLIKKISDFEIIVTDNEIEAFILESNLIKQHKPRYNINLKDDKSYPYIVITNEEFPQVYPTRKIIKDGSKYFGPYTEVKILKSNLKILRDIFKIRSCKYKIDDEFILKKKAKVCLDYHIKKCDGCCEGLISKFEYNKMIKQVIKVLNGKYEELKKELVEEMNRFSLELQFEKAAETKRMIDSLEFYSSKQKIYNSNYLDQDIISYAYENPNLVIVVFNLRNSILVGKKKFFFNYPFEITIEDVISTILNTHIEKSIEFPSYITFSRLPEDVSIYENYVSKETGEKIKIILPSDNDTNEIMKMCLQNAILELNELNLQKLKKNEKFHFSIVSLQKDLSLNRIPKKIECIDISHIQGSDTVASVICFENGLPKKNLYRKYIINTISGVDDFASIEEVTYRHFKKKIDEKLEFPDLLIIDGGKGQLQSALKSLTKLDLNNFPVISLAKKLEEVFLPNQRKSFRLPKTSSSLKLIQRIRDEAHRFAITFHRQRRSKRIIHSELIEIKGIGEKTLKLLLNKFGSIKAIENLQENELKEIVGLNKAKILLNYFQNKNISE